MAPRRYGLLHFLLLGSLLYALVLLVYLVFSVHSTSSLHSRILDSLGHMRRTPDQRQADDHAMQVGILPSEGTVERSFECIGWRATSDCSPEGSRLPELDRPCTKTIPCGQSGYCELQDKNTGELFKVARRTCADAVGKAALFRCLEAPRFANFRVLAHDAVQRALLPGFTLPNVDTGDHKPQDGIVMVVYPKIVPSAYATIRVLREVLRCRLPIEIWSRRDEMRKVTASIDPLHQLIANDTIDITFREIDDPAAVEFATKVFAIYHSAFDRVLFLDSDNVPVRDPSFLFQTTEFVDTGAVFWPDYWHPKHTLFYLGENSLLWELLDMPFVDMFEQESGQLLIDRRQHAAPLELLRFFIFHRPNPFVQLKLVWGDKDLFRLAWIKLNVPFYMVQTPPAVAGTVNGTSFCGMTMVQHDVQGKVLFLHRNAKKLTGEVLYKPVNYHIEARKRIRSRFIKQGIHKIPTEEEVVKELKIMKKTPPPTLEPAEPDGLADQAIWTHMLSFRKDAPLAEYKIKSYSAVPEFPEKQRCYGEREFATSKHFDLQKFVDLSFSGLETHVRRFAMEAAQIRHG